MTDDPRQQILCTFTRFRDQSAQNKRHYPCWQFTCLGSEARRPPYRMNQIRILSQRKGGFGILRVAMTALVFVGPRYNSVRKPAVSARFSEVNRAVSSVVERLVYTRCRVIRDHQRPLLIIQLSRVMKMKSTAERCRLNGLTEAQAGERGR